MKPRDLADKILTEVQKVVSGTEKNDSHKNHEKFMNFMGMIEKVDIAGPGFINFHLESTFFHESIATIDKEGDTFGSNKIGVADGKQKQVLVEYSSPTSQSRLRSDIFDRRSSVTQSQIFLLFRDTK